MNNRFCIFTTSHKGPTGFLSTCYPHQLTIDGTTYVSVEHYYQSQKFAPGPEGFPNDQTAAYYRLLLECDTSFKAIALGCRKKLRYSSQWSVNKRKPELGTVDDAIDRFSDALRRDDWHDHNIDVMRRANETKFAHAKFRRLLAQTGTAPLLYVQPQSSFWPWASNVVSKDALPEQTGENMLGAIITEIRATAAVYS